MSRPSDTLILIADKVENCTVYKKGDRLTVRIPEIIKEESDAICTHAIAGLLPILTALAKGVPFEDFGIGKETGRLRCIEPNGGVEFLIQRKT